MCACKEALCFQLCLKESGCAHHAHKLALVVVMAISFGTSTTARLSYWQVWRFSVFTVMHFTTRQFWCVCMFAVFFCLWIMRFSSSGGSRQSVCVCVFFCASLSPLSSSICHFDSFSIKEVPHTNQVAASSSYNVLLFLERLSVSLLICSWHR